MEEKMDSILLWVVVLIVWGLLGLQIIRENERGVNVILGDPQSVVSSGLRWTPFLFGKFLRYPTGIVELNFQKAGIITRKGKLPAEKDGSHEDRLFGTANIGVEVSFRFRWPHNDNHLIECVRLLPEPHDIPKLTSVFEEVILDHVRNVGGKKIWVELARDRKGFAQGVRESFMDTIATANNADAKNNGNIITDSHIEDPVIAIAHLDIPQALLDSLTAEEIAQQEKSASVIRAEATKQTLVLEGQGKAEARKTFIDAIGSHPRGMQVQSLLTLEAMAQGNATTIFPIPTDLMNQLSNMFGKPAGLEPQQLLHMLTPKQKQELLQLLTEAMNPRRRSL